MYDAHYDLLTILYFRMKNFNQYQDINKLISDLKSIYHDNNIVGGIINLYFMSKKEMKDELDINESELCDTISMFNESINNLKFMIDQVIIPKNTDFLYSIEGCDYIKNEEELEQLYEAGVRAILPVWNEKNKYGSGNRSEEGLTTEGVKLLKKAIDLGIIIDISHANENTFFDIMNLIEEEQKLGKKPIIIASHSNVKSLCNIKRNLTDEQLIKLKQVGGYIGLLVHGNFLTLDNEKITIDKRKPYFIKHLKYITQKIGFSNDKIIIATDNMNYHPNPEYHNLESFKIESINIDLKKYLKLYFKDDFINMIMKENMENLFKRVRKGFE